MFTSLLLEPDHVLVLGRKTQGPVLLRSGSVLESCQDPWAQEQASVLPWPAAAPGLLGAGFLSTAGSFVAVSSSSSERSPASGSSKSQGQKERQRSACCTLLRKNNLEAEAAVVHA